MHCLSKQFAIISLIGLLTAAAGCQAPVPPQAPVTTLWQKLGIPQGFQRFRDASLNRRGNRPGLEKKPPLLRLTDPANLESPVKAIQAAAEIKMKEDLAPQKIKAIKYLASVGCGCYDEEGKIEEAMLDMLKDYTEEVRLEAVNAIASAAGTCGRCYDGCSPTCCKPQIFKRLYAMAHEVDDDGCPIEPSAEVRRAAARAVSACGAVPQPEEDSNGDDEEPLEEKEEESSEELPPVEPEKATEELPPAASAELKAKVHVARVPRNDDQPEAEKPPVNELTPASSPVDLNAPSSDPILIQQKAPAPLVVAPQSYVETSDSEQRSVDLAGPVAARVGTSAPAGMIGGTAVATRNGNFVAVELPDEFDVTAGEKLLIMTTNGMTAVGELTEASGKYILVRSSELPNLGISVGTKLFLGMVAE